MNLSLLPARIKVFGLYLLDGGDRVHVELLQRVLQALVVLNTQHVRWMDSFPMAPNLSGTLGKNLWPNL